MGIALRGIFLTKSSHKHTLAMPLTPYPIPIPLACPHCGQKYSHGTMSSGNTAGAIFYSDGDFDAPMLYQEVAIIRCVQCKCFVWVNDMTVPNTQRFIDRLCSWKIVPKTKQLTVQELAEALTEGFAKSKEEERFLRLSLWQRFNDRIRKNWYPFKMTQKMKYSKLLKNEEEKRLWLENLTSLFDLLNVSDTTDRLTQAEIYREQGEFDKAIVILDEITDPGFEKSVKAIRQRCQNRDPFVTAFDDTDSSIFGNILLWVGILLFVLLAAFSIAHSCWGWQWAEHGQNLVAGIILYGMFGMMIPIYFGMAIFGYCVLREDFLFESHPVSKWEIEVFSCCVIGCLTYGIWKWGFLNAILIGLGVFYAPILLFILPAIIISIWLGIARLFGWECDGDNSKDWCNEDTDEEWGMPDAEVPQWLRMEKEQGVEEAADLLREIEGE